VPNERLFIGSEALPNRLVLIFERLAYHKTVYFGRTAEWISIPSLPFCIHLHQLLHPTQLSAVVHSPMMAEQEGIAAVGVDRSRFVVDILVVGQEELRSLDLEVERRTDPEEVVRTEVGIHTAEEVLLGRRAVDIDLGEVQVGHIVAEALGHKAAAAAADTDLVEADRSLAALRTVEEEALGRRVVAAGIGRGEAVHS
jgi:hypothetical protein